MPYLFFSQEEMCQQVSEDSGNRYPLLHLLMDRYSGLCEVICNLVIILDLLGLLGRGIYGDLKSRPISTSQKILPDR